MSLCTLYSKTFVPYCTCSAINLTHCTVMYCTVCAVTKLYPTVKCHYGILFTMTLLYVHCTVDSRVK